MNYKDYLKGFRQCREEISRLRSNEEKLQIEVNAMNRVLRAVNNNVPPRQTLSCSEDIIRRIRETELDLLDKLK